MSSTSEDDPPPQPRIKIPADVYTIPVSAATVGMVTGFVRGSRMSALRFLAENAHRAPTTLQGWYFYNKTKNYRVLLGGFKGGGKDAVRLGAVGSVWVAFEQGWNSLISLIDSEGGGISRLTHAKDVVAGVGTASVVSAISRLPRRMAMRTVGLGLGVGVLVGGLREVRDWLGKDLKDEENQPDA